MIIEHNGSDWYEVQLATLINQATNEGRYFTSSEQMIAYLTARPDQRHSLVANRLGDPLEGTKITFATRYGYDVGDLFCGHDVWYDTIKGRLVGISVVDEGRIWGG